ncbi:SRPBCC family protein [Kineosporia babensis]|uniref:SRPBCC domain-containing protein n=1 Tax=Kineosporia babensis TaxID=499548 RepID=A0A9X1NHR9_9ACTN|nr:SRPBCC family protein [Kineosporia babensis]MCD5313506.1 SRPBCC domain-containing protein [Kineosporia babensis]
MTEPQYLNDRERPAVRLERRYDHPVEQVWRAVTEPASLAKWFPSQVEFDLTAGKVVFDPQGDEPFFGIVLEADPPHRLVFTWDTDQLEFTLTPDGEGTVFTLVHLFDDRPGAASFATGWEICLEAMFSENAPAPQGRKKSDRHEELARRFGLDAPDVTRTASGWRLNYERQLSTSADRVWSLWLGASAVSVGSAFGASAGSDSLLGKITTVDAPREFAFEVADGVPGQEGRARFGAGTGQGARLILEVSGSGESELDAAAQVWGADLVEALARATADLANAEANAEVGAAGPNSA